MTDVIETQALGKRYRRRWALADCTLTIPAGRIVGLVGPNGAGKSTLLNLVSGHVRPSAGAIRVFGRFPATDAAHLARVGYVAQETPLYSGLSVADHLRFGARTNRVWDEDTAQRRISRLGLDPRQKAGSLSGGQRAQLALALAAAKQPELLLLDEPVAALDPLARRWFLQDLKDFAQERPGRTIVLSSHVVTDLEHVCDHLVLLSRSRVQLAGPCADIVAGHYLIDGDAEAPLASEARVIGGRPGDSGRREGREPLVVRAGARVFADRPGRELSHPNLEEIVLAYMALDPRTTDQPADDDEMFQRENS